MTGTIDQFGGHRFADPALLKQALTHRSAGAPHNERLEFLGDALLGLIIAEALYARWPRADEGALTRARALLVRKPALVLLARRLNLGKYLTLGPGEMKPGGHRRDSILADTVEAIIAAIYLDGGYAACREAVLPWFNDALDHLEPNKIVKDAKTRLQEWLQARHHPRPEYTLLSETGNAHARQFHVQCSIQVLDARAEARGPSRRDAEQLAAQAVLERLEYSASRPDSSPTMRE